MSTIAYKCPCCGAPLAYDGESGKVKCAACGNEYDVDAIEAMSGGNDESSIIFSTTSDSFSSSETGQMHAYVCPNCGAELMTDGTTTATECAYCGSPTVLPDNISGGVRPEKVLPFKITKEQAQKQFEDYFKGKRLMPNIFLNTRNRIAEMRKLYVPYWLFDCDASADIVFDAEKSDTSREGDYEVTRTRHYMVRRAGSLGFDSIPVDASSKLDNMICESLEPYDMSKAVEFSPAVLAGAMADRADTDVKKCEARAVERVKTSTEQAMRDTVNGYDSVTVRSRNIRSTDGKATPVLLPVWLITTEKQVDGKKQVYTFAINGQTGELTCDVPADMGKSFGWFMGIFAGVCAVGYGLLVLLNAMGVL